MKTRTYRNRISCGALLFAALVGGIFAIPAGHAQTAAAKLDSRYLLVFDTASEMKRRLPAVKGALAALLATSANGQMHSNDSVGVWTFDEELHAGQFPLQRWQPDHAALIASNISVFISGQTYSKKTGFGALMPVLNKVVQNSDRLTVVIFCDGNGEIHGTPYDSGINQIFKSRQSERQKARLPIAVALRAQLGQYVDCMVSFPPQPVTLPEFPPLPPPPPPPTPKVASAPPRPVVPPLIVIGTPPTNRVLPTPSNPPPVTATSTPVPAAASQASPPMPGPAMPTGAAPARLTFDTALLSGTNTVTPPAEDFGISRISALAMGLGFLTVAGGLTFFLFRRARAMKKD
jgi:hypothetical protein